MSSSVFEISQGLFPNVTLHIQSSNKPLRHKSRTSFQLSPSVWHWSKFYESVTYFCFFLLGRSWVTLPARCTGTNVFSAQSVNSTEMGAQGTAVTTKLVKDPHGPHLLEVYLGTGGHFLLLHWFTLCFHLGEPLASLHHLHQQESNWGRFQSCHQNQFMHLFILSVQRTRLNLI